MSGDELDYLYRLRKVGNVISVLDAIHYHPDQSQRPYTPAKAYYFIKNSLILNTRYLNAVWIRHALTIAVVVVRTASRNSIRAALSLLLGKNAPIFYLAIIRGLRGKLGKILMSKFCALVAAAGSGTRANLSYPKTLFHIDGKPILIRIIDLISPYDQCPTIIVSPSGKAPIQECLNASGVIAYLVEQIYPRGMGDAVLHFAQSPAF